MKTPNRPKNIRLNKFVFHSTQNINRKKDKSNDIKEKLYDEIELKDLVIKNNHKKIKKIKIDSIKQLVYANKNIPKYWKSKLDYPNQVLELFSKDSNFLNYVGTGGNMINSDNLTKSTKNLTVNRFNKTNNNFTEESNKNANLNKKKLKLSIGKENLKLNNLKKYCYTTPNRNKYKLIKENIVNDKEILNILDELQINYPIKEKLNELFPEEEIEKIRYKKEILKNKANKYFKIRCPIINAQKNKNVLKNNIYVNLIASSKKEQIKDDIKKENINKRYINDYDIDLLKMKKEMIKNPLANKYLERINYYGPYYSYCPSCGIRNLNFYQKLPINNLFKFTRIINQYRKKNKEIK